MYTSQQCNLKAHKAKLIAQQKETEIGTGNTCKPTADSCQCMAKPLQYCKVIIPQLIKISEKKKKLRNPPSEQNIPTHRIGT